MLTKNNEPDIYQIHGKSRNADEGSHRESKGITRRQALGGYLGAVATMRGLGWMEVEKAAFPAAPPIDPALVDGLNFVRSNLVNPSIVFDPNRGLLAGFGNNLYHFDYSSNHARLFSGQTLLLESAVMEEETGIPDRVALGNRYTIIEDIEEVATATAPVNKYRFVTTVQAIMDASPGQVNLPSLFNPSSPSVGLFFHPAKATPTMPGQTNCSLRLTLTAAVAGNAPSFKFETIYSYLSDFFPLGFEVAGELPLSPTFRLLALAGDVIHSGREPRSYPNSPRGGEQVAAMKLSFWKRLAVCAAAIAAAAATGAATAATGGLAGAVVIAGAAPAVGALSKGCVSGKF